MITFTKEQLIASAHARIEFAEMMLAGELEPLKERTWSIELELARIALASLEAEAVAWDHEWASCITCDGPQNFERIIEHEAPPEWAIKSGQARNITPLYTAPPAPVSVPEPIKRNDADGWWMYKGRRVGGGCAEWYNRALEDYRAAMPHGAEPVTTDYKLPANTPCKDAPEHIWLQTAGVWPENGEFSELTWCSDNQHKDDTLYVRADVVSGNSPVIPDGWVMVPVEPTMEMMDEFDSIIDYGAEDSKEAWRRLIAAAPQQEVKS